MYGEGISWEGTVLDTGLDRKIVQKSGSYFSFGDERLGQGRQNATAFLKEHPDLVQTDPAGHPGDDGARADRLGPAAAAGWRRAEVTTGRGRSRRRSGGRGGGARSGVAPRVTALVAEPRDRVRVELDGEPWRVLPAGAVVGGAARGRDRARPAARAHAPSRAAAPRSAGRRDRRAGSARPLGRRARGAARAARRRAAGARRRARRRSSAPATSTTRRFAASRAERARRAAATATRRSARPRAARPRRRGHRELRSPGCEPESERAARLVARLGPPPKTARRLARRVSRPSRSRPPSATQDVLTLDG